MGYPRRLRWWDRRWCLVFLVRISCGIFGFFFGVRIFGIKWVRTFSVDVAVFIDLVIDDDGSLQSMMSASMWRKLDDDDGFLWWRRLSIVLSGSLWWQYISNTATPSWWLAGFSLMMTDFDGGDSFLIICGFMIGRYYCGDSSLW